MPDNYAIQAERARELFMLSDQEEIIRKLRLPHDGEYLYVRFMDTTLRVERATGRILGAGEDDTLTPMAVYDYLCYSRVDRRPAGEWATTTSLGLMFHRALAEGGEPSETAMYFDRHSAGLHAVCAALGGVRRTPGDVSYILTLFDELQVWLQLWRGDEEFPAKLTLLWDKNALQYVRYETLWYITAMVYGRLRGLVDGLSLD
jgi:hypothetical protein